MGAKPRILIVDDDPVIRRLLQVSFRLEGFEVETSAKGGGTIAQAGPFDPGELVHVVRRSMAAG